MATIFSVGEMTIMMDCCKVAIMMDCCDDVFSDGHGQMQWPFGYFVAVPDSDTA